MNLFNRLLIILASLIILVSAVMVLLVTLDIYAPADLAPSAWFQDRLTPYANLDSTTSDWTVGISIAVIVVSLLLLGLELWPRSSGPRRLVIKEDGLGQVTMTRNSIRDIVNWEASQTEGVMEAQSQVEEESDGLRIVCRVALDPQVDAPEVTHTLQERIKTSVEHHVGRHVSQVAIDTQVAPLADHRRVR